jgi:hypothetical protein
MPKFQKTITLDELRTRNVVSQAEAITQQATEDTQHQTSSDDDGK